FLPPSLVTMKPVSVSAHPSCADVKSNALMALVAVYWLCQVSAPSMVAKILVPTPSQPCLASANWTAPNGILGAKVGVAGANVGVASVGSNGSACGDGSTATG